MTYSVHAGLIYRVLYFIYKAIHIEELYLHVSYVYDVYIIYKRIVYRYLSTGNLEEIAKGAAPLGAMLAPYVSIHAENPHAALMPKKTLDLKPKRPCAFEVSKLHHVHV